MGILLKTLLRTGADRRALTTGTKDWVTEDLEWKNLTAETVARDKGTGRYLGQGHEGASYILLCRVWVKRDA